MSWTTLPAATRLAGSERVSATRRAEPVSLVPRFVSGAAVLTWAARVFASPGVPLAQCALTDRLSDMWLSFVSRVRETDPQLGVFAVCVSSWSAAWAVAMRVVMRSVASAAQAQAVLWVEDALGCVASRLDVCRIKTAHRSAPLARVVRSHHHGEPPRSFQQMFRWVVGEWDDVVVSHGHNYIAITRQLAFEGW